MQENLPRAERAISKWDSYPDMRKAVMEDSAQEVDNHSDLLAQQRNLIKVCKCPESLLTVRPRPRAVA